MFRTCRRLRCAATGASTNTSELAKTKATPSLTTKTATSTASPGIGNTFAAKPDRPTSRWVINEAGDRHQGFGIYRSRQDVTAVLQAVRVTKPSWWCRHCDDVLARMVSLAQVPYLFDVTERRGAVIVIEGLDGVGKSTVTKALAAESELESVQSSTTSSYFVDKQRHLFSSKDDAEADADAEKATTMLPGAILLRTPDPSLDIARSKFRVLEDPIARAFYCAANYIAGEAVHRLAKDRVVVLDRWWCSTCAMALATRSMHLSSSSSSSSFSSSSSSSSNSAAASELENYMSHLPAPDAWCYLWPSDLPSVDLRILLDVPEDIRLKRMAKRGDENAEERVLAEKEALRATAMAAYKRMQPPLEIVEAPNYAAAVNEIVGKIEQRPEVRKLMPGGAPRKYSKEFVDGVAPF